MIIYDVNLYFTFTTKKMFHTKCTEKSGMPVCIKFFQAVLQASRINPSDSDARNERGNYAISSVC